SSLMRALAGSDAFIADALFATLDPLTRRINVDDQGFLLTDTVGFIQKLPTQLVSAFKATLEELESADLLVHAVDVTSEAAAAQAETVFETLDGLGLAEKPVLTVLNKADGLELPDGRPVEGEADLEGVEIANPAGPGEALLVSALRGWGIGRLRRRIAFEVLGEPAALLTS
ncbi:MAG: GTPase, partial [Dehalococcoidia bacterium]